MTAPNAPRSSSPKRTTVIAMAALLCLAAVGGIIYAGSHNAQAEEAPADAIAGKVDKGIVRVQPDQVASFDIGKPEKHEFSNVRHSIGVIDFNQDRTAKVFSSYQGRVSQVLVKAGDDVRAGQVLYTVAVPDMAQAASALVSASATLRNANETLKRAETLAKDNSIPQKEFLQAQADQQSAKAAYDAAHQNLRLFDLSDADIGRMERDRKIGLEFAVKSPIAGRVTQRSAQPGQLVQPGSDPAPIVVSDMRSLWMVANVPESEFSQYRLGQPVQVHVSAWPGKSFDARVSYVGDSVDADSRRFVVRAEVADPEHVLRPQMTADFNITVAAAEDSLAVPAQAVVREGNGHDVVWLAMGKDAKGPLFTKTAVVRGKTSDGWVQIEQGLKSDQLIARKNALFLSSLYETDAQ
ncbi:efflux RND transporter periplasmic adaptor subunit [Comamonas sp. Tr-654]|uniref:efflux RND transporter periplasmic adaptor subunit n=1 Tax=Comamonas sp. Tr-654 TaxID=2608341 RepID=UPI001423F9BB|nr:efflux RND transporter periplasmic adaptor subunit [Comamonas sp. Tr-654]NIF86125.1 efflux RND transporter periplasmic adaptor subunit [Comamonas sp. Tr-654]